MATAYSLLDGRVLRADALRSTGPTNESNAPESGLRLNAEVAPFAGIHGGQDISARP